jgi:hypothetical protein
MISYGESKNAGLIGVEGRMVTRDWEEWRGRR